MNDLSPIEILLTIIYPSYQKRSSAEEIIKDRSLLRSVIQIAEKNGLYHLIIQKLSELNIDISALGNNRLENEEQRLLEFKETLMILNRISRDYEIDYILIKSCDSIPHIPRDIDIFVHRENRKKLVKALENLGMECIQSSITETSLKGEHMKVDIYTEICYINTTFMEGSFLWKSRVINDKIFGIDLPRLNNEASFILMLVHSLFGHGSISLLDFLHMKNLRNNIQDIDICRKYAYEKSWGLTFDLGVKKLDNLDERIYNKLEIPPFPYCFDRGFRLKCVYGIEGLNLGNYAKMLLYFTIILDEVMFDLKESSLYDLLKSSELIANLVNHLTAFIKRMRGDEKSMTEVNKGK